MRDYLLDTAPLAALLNRRPHAVSLLTSYLSRDQLATSILTYAEALEYLKGLADFTRRRTDLRRLLRGVRPYFLTYAIVDRYTDIRRALRPPHGPGLIGDVDTLVAATALEYDLTLITTDSDFIRVPGLKLLLLERTTFVPRTP